MSLNKMLLSRDLKLAVSTLIDTQQYFIYLNQILSQKENTGMTTPVISMIKDVSTKISNVLKNFSNGKELEKNIFKLNGEISSLGKSGIWGTLVQANIIDEPYVKIIQSRVESNVTKTYNALEQASKSKSAIHDSLNSQNLKSLVGGSLSVIEHLIPGGNIIKHAGNAAYKLWEMGNKSSYAKDAPILNNNLWGLGVGSGTSEDTQTAINTPTFNNQGTGGTTGGGGGWAGGMNANFTPNGKGSKWKDASSGQFVSGGSIAQSWSNDPLFRFFNTGAYFAGWTKDVLKALNMMAGIKSSGRLLNNLITGGEEALALGGATGLGAMLKKFFRFGKAGGAVAEAEGAMVAAGEGLGIGAMMGSILPFIGSAIAVGGPGLAGWGAGRWLGEHVKIGGKTLDYQMQNVFSGGKIAQYEAQDKASQIKLLQLILEEHKKQNSKKEEKSSSNTANSTQRPIYKDLGDSTTEILNSGLVSNPRR